MGGCAVPPGLVTVSRDPVPGAVAGGGPCRSRLAAGYSHAVTWELPHLDVPTPPWREPGVTRVDEAIVTPFARGGLRAVRSPTRWMTGAVHRADGRLVPRSQYLWHGIRNAPIAADPPQVEVPAQARRLGGTRLYAGHWSNHFGHFLLETLPSFWPVPEGALTGIVAHRPPRGQASTDGPPRRTSTPTLAPWQADLLALAGYGGLPVHVVQGRHLRVERLVVPERPVLLKRWVQPPAVALWQRMAVAAGPPGPHRRVFLSRTRFQADHPDRARTSGGWDALLESTASQAGFEIVHPETLPIAEQVALVRGAAVVAGTSGSALHLSVFAEPGTRVLTIGDQRSPQKPVRQQSLLERAVGQPSRFVAYGDEAALHAAFGDA